MSASKKAKTDDFDTLRQYIMNCPDVPKDSPAVQAALKGLEQEVQKRERDAKLQRKFATKNNLASTEESNNSNTTMKLSDEKASTTNSTTIVRGSAALEVGDDDDDWHDVATSSEDQGTGGEDYDAESSALGVLLSKAVIASIAEAQILVETPTAAIALALHAALRSDILGFACTGIPEQSKAGDFAPPIRELPKTQFLPPKWDEHATRQTSSTDHQHHVALRYRKSGTGSVLLVVTLEDDTIEPKIRIQLIPATTLTQEPPNAEGMVVALHQHINPDSFAAALKQGKVQPALHYKRLAVLLTAFMNRFDLGHVKENNTPMEDVWNNSSVEQQPPQEHQSRFTTTLHPPGGDVYHDPLRVADRNSFPGLQFIDPSDQRGPQINIFDRHYPASDFAGDLMPGGLVGPNLGPYHRPGNLMGPDHPVFHGVGGISGVGPNSGFGMKPRFDPFGPPGGPTEPFDIGNGNKPKTPIPPGGTGDPNHDHMRPPNNFNNNMFG